MTRTVFGECYNYSSSTFLYKGIGSNLVFFVFHCPCHSPLPNTPAPADPHDVVPWKNMPIIGVLIIGISWQLCVFPKYIAYKRNPSGFLSWKSFQSKYMNTLERLQHNWIVGGTYRIASLLLVCLIFHTLGLAFCRLDLSLLASLCSLDLSDKAKNAAVNLVKGYPKYSEKCRLLSQRQAPYQ